MSPFEIALLVGGGLVAGVVNTLAGGGSLLTVPLLVVLGLPGTVANGTNRVGVLLQCLVAVWRFRAEGVFELRNALRALPPIALGATLGAAFISQVADAVFERLFGAMMLVLLVPMLLRRPAPRASSGPLRWSPFTSGAVFFGIGLYAGALQAGVGIPLLFALNHAGLDMVRGNAVKLVLILAVALVAVPIFAFNGQIAWLPAAALSCGFFVGAAVGARLAVRGGERVIRPVLVVAVIAMAGRMFGLY